jgi:amino acid transporter/nucleotide-binding universal stress UspA family protein
MAKQQNGNQIKTELSRDMGLTSALAIGIGTMIAAGIFTLSGLAVRNVGSAAIVSFLLAALVALFTALTYCEFVSIYPRTGEGYLYARKTFKPPFAYFVGWSLFLGYASSCAFYIASLSSYFNEFIWHSPVTTLPGLTLLLALTFLNIKGTEESGKFQIIVTSAKIILLIWFIIGGLKFVNMEEVMDRFSTDIGAIGSTAAMVFITFFGFSAIAASAGEVKDPVKNITRAIFISMGVVTVLYTAVVLVLLFAGLTEYTEASMGDAAKKFLGPIGGLVIIAGAIFSMISASNASIMAGSRVLLSMSQLGHMPRELGVINPKTRTPIIALLMVSGLIMVFAMFLPLEDLSYFANTVLLLALITVNAALIVHRKKYPDIKRPFKVPLVPLLPLLAIAANIYLITQIFQNIVPLLLAVGALLIGILSFVAWKGRQTAEDAITGLSSHIAVSEGRSNLDKNKFRVLVPIANPATMDRLINLAAAIAKQKNGEVLLLKVLTVPEQLSPRQFDATELQKHKEQLYQGRKICDEIGVPSHGIIRVGHNVARAILESSTEHNCEAVVLGWKGYTNSRDKILGNITDTLVRHAHADILLVKFVGEHPIKKILLPSAGGEHAQCAEQYSAAFASAFNGSVTVCRVVPKHTSENEKSQVSDLLEKTEERVMKNNGEVKVNRMIIESDSVSEGIIEAGKDFDTLMVGATKQSIYPQILFGNIPEDIAKRANKTVIVVKHYHPIKSLLGRVMAD